MVAATFRLPGVVFEAPTPVPEETLPRMDIAAFVGFAAAGPLHVPVAIDSPRRFRDVFGSDPALAWDEERGEMRYAQLGGAVDAFFANGGLRCWVVRVADETATVRHAFTVPGLIDAANRDASPLVYAAARARAAGSWCERLAVGTALAREPLALAAPDVGTAIDLVAGAYRVDLVTGRTRVQPGDLLEIVVGPTAPILLLFAERVEIIPGGVRVRSAGLEGGDTAGAFWIEPAIASAPFDAQLDVESLPPVALAEAPALTAALAALAVSPPVRPTIRRLSFELLIWEGSELRHSLDNLTFGRVHPRCWARLMTDESLFRVPPGAGVSPNPTGLARDAAAPRFPLAGTLQRVVENDESYTPVRYFLPWGMGRLRAAERARPLDAAATATTSSLERDGLATFAPGLFLDHRLAHLNSGTVLGEAEYRHYVAGQKLEGVHGLLPLEEVSLVACPDAVHRGWSRALPPTAEPLGAPELLPIGSVDAAGRYEIHWTAVSGADAYLLQYAVAADFRDALAAYDGDALTTPLVLPPSCPRDVFVRVRASRDGEIGPWSNTRTARLPEEPFAPCGMDPVSLVLAFSGDFASPGPAITWSNAASAEPLPAAVQLEEAADPAFASATTFAPDGLAPGYAPLAERRFSVRYYRVRAHTDRVIGPWSNTVRVDATERASFTLDRAGEFDSSALLAIHRALLRFAAARGDLMAVLSLPDHFLSHHAIEHTALLTPGGPELEPAPPASSPLFPRVPPLTEGEDPVLSYGALYHPWIVMRAARAGAAGALRRLPPDGTISGMIAAVALQDGAWRAPANRTLTGAVALTPALPLEEWPRLVTNRINALVNDPRGLLTKSQDTLGGERALERVHVRRLMILLRRLAIREGNRWVFEPHGPLLRRRVRQLFERFLAELFQRGAFAGRDASEGFRVVADDAVNRPSSVDAGRLIVELRVAPVAALTFITVRLLTAGAGRLVVEEGVGA